MKAAPRAATNGASARPLACALLLALLPCALAGCFIRHQSAGRALPAGAAGLEIGRSTKAEVLAFLGPPASIRRQFDGDLLLWRRDALHSETLLLVPLIPIYERTRANANSDVLALLFDHAGVLLGVGEVRGIP